jgi:hypothetical protein
VRPGDVLLLGGGISMVPAQGWNIEQGLRVTDGPADGGQVTPVEGGLSFPGGDNGSPFPAA